MANKNNSAEVQGAESAKSEILKAETTQTALVVGTDSDKINQLQGLFEMFEQQDTAVMKSLTADYLDLKENTTYNFICTGMTTFVTSEGEEREAAVLVDKANKTFINGGAVLVSSCKKLKEYPALIRIITGGKVNSASGAGKYLSMEVRSL